MKKRTKTKKRKRSAPARKGARKSTKSAGAKRSARKSIKKATRPKRAPAKPKASEVLSDSSLGSSLTTTVTRAARDDSPAYRGGQSGDLQGISEVADADPESVAELLEDGQALEAEIVEGVEDAPDERPVPSRGRIEDDSVPDYDDRNKL